MRKPSLLSRSAGDRTSSYTHESGHPFLARNLLFKFDSGLGIPEYCLLAMMAPFHDRMPAILPHAIFEPWLNPETKDVAQLKPILIRLPSDEMQAWPVSKDVGNVRNQGEHLIERISG